jgi:CRISPR-associated endonuclease/helicase Cas3
MESEETFDVYFEGLTGHTPFPWQRALFREFLAKRFVKTCDIPTGLGKTSILAIWVLALAHHVRVGAVAGFPRRLVYVVNRRTVVDQATRETEHMRDALATNLELKQVADAVRSLAACPSDSPLAISTLRGQFADNAEWRDDPARPAVVVGTVDMVGSRLLFGGYGCGFKSRPLHAGFLGQDTVLVHDEAHLEPAFQELIGAIEAEQRRCREFGCFRVMALTATSRSGDDQFQLTDADRDDSEVRKRLSAKKGVAFFSIRDENQTADQVAQHARQHKDSGQAILVFLRKLDDVERVTKTLRKTSAHVQTLTGTLRGLERDNLAKQDLVFARFLRNASVTSMPDTVYLVCTSAGEVGTDISADHLVCDLTPFDSMAQRFGRVNRFGDGDATLDVVFSLVAETTNAKTRSPLDEARERTLSLLQKLPLRKDERRDASPEGLASLPLAERQAAFSPSPVILPSSEILFDAWALTSVRGKLPGRPPVVDWLHGVASWEPDGTRVAWREEVGCVTGELLDSYLPEDLLEDYPVKQHELLRDQTTRVLGHLEAIAARRPNLPAWLIEADSKVRVLSLVELVERNKQKKPVVNLADCTVLLPPAAGGLENGMLDGVATFDDGRRDVYDVADRWMDQNEVPRRCRIWDDVEPPVGMRLIRVLDTRPDGDEESGDGEQASGRRYWRWYVRPRSADDDGSRTARCKQELEPHLQSARQFAGALVGKLGLSSLEASAVTLAARWHDLGKDRAVWQRSIGNRDYPRQVLAKSGGKMRITDLTGYRHELGSLLDVSRVPEFLELEPEVQDLVLHLIASHHGRARPCFPAQEAFDPQYTETDTARMIREVPRRFARLQQKYGRWGLAYIESLVRAADALASQSIEVGGLTDTSPQESSQ